MAFTTLLWSATLRRTVFNLYLKNTMFSITLYLYIFIAASYNNQLHYNLCADDISSQLSVFLTQRWFYMVLWIKTLLQFNHNNHNMKKIIMNTIIRTLFSIKPARALFLQIIFPCFGKTSRDDVTAHSVQPLCGLMSKSCITTSDEDTCFRGLPT